MVNINNFSNNNGIEELESISEYINYGIHFTIVKQLGNIESLLETKYAIKLLDNFINGKTNAFTSKNNIRTNMKSINFFKIITLLIKAAIERHAFNIVKLKKIKMENNEDIIAEAITEQIADGNLDEILNGIDSDKSIIPILIENYIDLFYQSDEELRNAYSYMVSKHPMTKRAMEQLEHELNLYNNYNKLK